MGNRQTGRKMNKRRILHVISGLRSGGAELMLWKLLSMTNRELFSSIVVPLSRVGMAASKIDRLGVPVIPVKMGVNLLAPLSLLRLSRIVGRVKPDVIQGWMYHGNLSSCIVGFMKSAKTPPFLWNIRHTFYDWRDYNLRNKAIIKMGAWLSKRPSRIIYNSYSSERKHNMLGYCSQKSCVIPNGFDCELFKPSGPSRIRVRDELGVSYDAIIIGLIARYHPMKDHGTFLLAARELAVKYKNVHFLLAGRGVDLNNKALQGILNELGLRENVHLLGERDDIPDITSAFDIAVNCSAWGESFPNSMGEAMACEVPCVVSDVGDCARLVGNSGRVVPPQNHEALANAWEYLIEVGPEKRNEMGKRARQRIIEEFSLRRIVECYEGVYSRVLGESHKREEVFLCGCEY